MYGRVLYEVAQRSVDERASAAGTKIDCTARAESGFTRRLRRLVGGALVAAGSWVGGF